MNDTIAKLLFNPIELLVQIANIGRFAIKSSLPINEAISVELYSNVSRDFLTIKNPHILIEANSTAWHDVTFVPHGAKSDFWIRANCSQNFTSACPFDLIDSQISLTSVHSLPLNIVIVIIGWIYFAAWSISFYPQIFLNCKRKSVVGLHFDFLVLNVTGFLFYALYNVSLYWIPIVRDEYVHRFPANIFPVLLNDVVFALHAFAACLFLTIQCIIYDRGTQKISYTVGSLCGVFWLIALVALFVVSVTKWFLWLDFFNTLSYIKLAITLVKYIPQALYNYKRKSTIGWSIGNILLDFTGGAMSLLQMVLIAYNNDTFDEFFSNFTKFGLGCISLMFDLLFIFQHYVLYRNAPIICEESIQDEDTSGGSNEEANPQRSANSIVT